MPGNHQIVCPACSAVNRIPKDKPAGAGKCGKCGNALFSGKPLDADADMFSRQTDPSDIPILVDAWAPWCGPCRMMAPAFEAAAAILEPDNRSKHIEKISQMRIAFLSQRGAAAMLDQRLRAASFHYRRPECAFRIAKSDPRALRLTQPSFEADRTGIPGPVPMLQTAEKLAVKEVQFRIDGT